MATQVILLERIEKLGAMGDIVDVKPGYARNYLLPQRKALRASKDNIAYFESQKAALEKANNEKKVAAEKRGKDLDGLKVVMIRQAGETGQLYGSVTGRDIADAINEVAKDKIERNMVVLNQNIKTIGLIPVEVALHAEVKVTVTVNIARTDDEAVKQEKTGKALIADEFDAPSAQEVANDSSEEMKADLMEEDALEAEKAAKAEAEEKAAEEAEKSEAKSAARAEKKAAAAAEAEAAEAEAEEASQEEAPETQAKAE